MACLFYDDGLGLFSGMDHIMAVIYLIGTAVVAGSHVWGKLNAIQASGRMVGLIDPIRKNSGIFAVAVSVLIKVDFSILAQL